MQGQKSFLSLLGGTQNYTMTYFATSYNLCFHTWEWSGAWLILILPSSWFTHSLQMTRHKMLELGAGEPGHPKLSCAPIEQEH